MGSFSEAIQSGGLAAWLFIPSAIMLGALHGLEPGHSKTMMAAFIIAVRGTVGQAILLGVAATLSHTAIVWLVSLVGMGTVGGIDAETTEPYFQVASAALVITIALWMLYRTWHEQQQAKAHAHAVDHDHGPDVRRINTGHGVLGLQLAEAAGGPARLRIHTLSGDAWAAQDVSVALTRPNGARKLYRFAAHDGVLESVDAVPEPHVFTATLNLEHGDHDHGFDVEFGAPGHHGHDHDHDHGGGLDVSTGEYQDAHALAHANDIKRRFANRQVTTGQIVMFGLTGGLIPCPAAITVLILCLQLKQFFLGVLLVTAFSVGLALTMVAAGVAAAISVQQVQRRWSGFGAFAQRAPYVSSVVIIGMGLYMGYDGLRALSSVGVL